MNERELFRNWKDFAEQNAFEFQYEDQRHLQGTITHLYLKNHGKPIFKSRIGKTGTACTQEWTKLFLDIPDPPKRTIKNQNRFSKMFTKNTPLEKQIQKILKSVGASELTVSKSESFIKFEHILFSRKELEDALKLKEQIWNCLVLNN